MDWEDISDRRPGYCGGDLHATMDMDGFDPDVWKRMDYAHSRPDGGETRDTCTVDLVYMCRTVVSAAFPPLSPLHIVLSRMPLGC